MSDLLLSEKTFISQLFEEDNVNKLLINFNFKKPGNVFDIYIREQFKDNKELYNRNIYNKNPSKDFTEKIKEYTEIYNKLDNKGKSIYKRILYKENMLFFKNIEILKKYIFKGVDGNLIIKKTAFQIFLSNELIEGLDKKINIKTIIDEAKYKWESLELKIKKKYLLLEKDNNNFLDIVQNYKNINSFLIFISLSKKK